MYSDDSGARPTARCASEHLGQLTFGERIADSGAQPVRGHLGLIDDLGLRYRRSPCGWPGWSAARRPEPQTAVPALVCRARPGGELGASGCGCGRTHRSAAGRGVAGRPGRRSVFYRPGRADEPDQELIRAHETDRRPGRDHRPDRTVGPALGRVRCEGRRDPQAEQLAGQGGYGDPGLLGGPACSGRALRAGRGCVGNVRSRCPRSQDSGSGVPATG